MLLSHSDRGRAASGAFARARRHSVPKRHAAALAAGQLPAVSERVSFHATKFASYAAAAAVSATPAAALPANPAVSSELHSATVTAAVSATTDSDQPSRRIKSDSHKCMIAHCSIADFQTMKSIISHSFECLAERNAVGWCAKTAKPAPANVCSPSIANSILLLTQPVFGKLGPVAPAVVLAALNWLNACVSGAEMKNTYCSFDCSSAVHIGLIGRGSVAQITVSHQVRTLTRGTKCAGLPRSAIAVLLAHGSLDSNREHAATGCAQLACQDAQLPLQVISNQ